MIASLLSIETGLRIGEVCALTWDDVATDNGIISVRHTIQRIYILEGEKKHTELILDTPKTKKSIRDIPMTRDLFKVLKPLKKL